MIGIKRTLGILLTVANVVLCHAQKTIKLKSYQENLQTVDVFIEGKKYNFLFDSGGAETIISPEIANKLGKKIYGHSVGFRMSGEMLTSQKCDGILMKIGAVNHFHPTVGVLDIMSIFPKEFEKVDGVISLKSFNTGVLTIDLSNNKLIVETSTSAKARIRGKSVVPSRFANGLEGNELNVFIGIPKNGFFYWFLFDTGNSGPLLLSPSTANVWDVKLDQNNPQALAQSREFIVGPKILNVSPFIRPIIYDGVLNYSTISKNVFVIDFIRSKVWM